MGADETISAISAYTVGSQRQSKLSTSSATFAGVDIDGDIDEKNSGQITAEKVYNKCDKSADKLAEKEHSISAASAVGSISTEESGTENNAVAGEAAERKFLDVQAMQSAAGAALSHSGMVEGTIKKEPFVDTATKVMSAKERYLARKMTESNQK